MFHLLKDRNFSLFWWGQMLSVIGDHISLIAFPWLVLQLTSSPFMTSVAFAVQGVPRAIFMLLGGATVDRLSPRKVLILTNLARLVIVGALAGLLFIDQVSVPAIFALALLFGLADAFYYPAEQGMIPSLVKREDLQAGNALNQIVLQMGIILGPMIAGIVIAGEIMNVGDHKMEAGLGGNYSEDRLGLARAFALDGLTFLVSVLALLALKTRSLKNEEEEEKPSLVREVREALSYVAKVPAMRLAFIGIALLELCFQAPIFVGLPVLADTRFTDGAAAFGLLVSAYGVGSLIGGGTSGSVKAMNPNRVVMVMFLLFAWSGATMGLILLYDPIWWGALLFFTAGLGDGFIWVQFVTWLQRLTPEAMIGRVMSILMVLSVGLLPVAYLVVGLMIEQLGIALTLGITSSLIFVASLGCSLHPDRSRLGAGQAVLDKAESTAP